jgi:HK97 family phage portal protein
VARLPAILDRALGAIGLARSASIAPGPGSVYWPSGAGGILGSWQAPTMGFGGGELTAFSAIYACVQKISGDVAKLPVGALKVDTKTGAYRPMPAPPIVERLRAPNDYQTQADFMQGFCLSYLLQGNAYATGTKDRSGNYSALHVLDPRSVEVLIAEDGSVFYRCGDNKLAGIKPGTIIPERSMIHHRLPLAASHPLVGVTPIYAAAASSAVGLRILQSQQAFFANASRPSGTLNAPGKISKETADRLAQEWDQNFNGSRAGKTAVLPEGLKWEALSVTAADAMLVEQLKFSIEDVCRVFGVPSFLVNGDAKATYRNSEAAVRAYLSSCLGYHLATIEQRFSRAGGLSDGETVRLDLAPLLRAEIDIRFDAYQKGLQSGWSTINEVRALEGLDPVEGGDEPHIQSQYVPLSQAGEAMAAKVNPSPAEPPKPADDEEPDEDDAPEDPEAAKAMIRAAMRARRREIRSNGP